MKAVVAVQDKTSEPQPSDGWAQKAFLLSGVNAGKETNANNRIADLTYYEAAAKELKITPDSQVKYAVFSYDADKKFLGWSNWCKGEKYTLTDGAVYFRVEAAYANDGVIDETNMAALKAVVAVQDKASEPQPGDSWDEKAFVLSGPNAGKETSANNRLADLTYYEAAAKELKVEPNSLVKYAVLSYDENKSFLSWSGWCTGTAYTVTDGAKYFRVEVAYANDRVIDADNMAALKAVVTVQDKAAEPEPSEGWVKKAFLFSGPNAGKETNANNRLADLTYYAAADYAVIGQAESLMKYAVMFYDAEKTFLGWSGWQRGASCPMKDGTVYFRVEASYMDDREITDENMEALKGKVTVAKDGVSASATVEGESLQYRATSIKVATVGMIYPVNAMLSYTGAASGSVDAVLAAEGEPAEIVLDTVGDYEVTVALKDAQGKTATATVAVHVVNEFTLDNVKYQIASAEAATVLGVAQPAAEVVVPETVNGFTVTEVAAQAFEGDTVLTSIDLPDTVEKIGRRAFANCTNLSEMK